MSDRERWIVYPIVFLALVLGLNNYIHNGSNVSFGALRCSSLVVESPDGRVRLRASGVGKTGELVIYGEGTTPLFSVAATNGGKSGQVRISGAKGANVTFAASDDGSSVVVESSKVKPKIVLGHADDQRHQGLFAYDVDKSCLATSSDTGIWFMTRSEIREVLKQDDEAKAAEAEDAESGIDAEIESEPNDTNAETDDETSDDSESSESDNPSETKPE